MGRIWLTSDLHFGHDRGFIYKPRGFENIQEHDQTIISNWNILVQPHDEVYILGDLMLRDTDYGMDCLSQLVGHKHLILGNHDTPTRIERYKEIFSEQDIMYATMLHYNGYHFFLSHFPSLTGNFNDKLLKGTTCNLFGHTHQKTNFYQDIPFMYHVGLDSHNCCPILIDDVIKDMEAKCVECIEML